MEANLALQFANTSESKMLYAVNLVILIIFLYFYFTNSIRLIRGELTYKERHSLRVKSYSCAVTCGILLISFLTFGVPLESSGRQVFMGTIATVAMLGLTFITDRYGMSLSKDKKPPS